MPIEISKNLGALRIDTAMEQKLAGLAVRPKAPDQFRAALSKLSQDSAYRAEATKDPGRIVTDFNLSLKELSALRTAAAMSGADISVVDKLSAASIALRATKTTDVDVSCCSCCCCCCGETAVAPSGW